ncbi:MAG TPA: AI-2E family transporter [Candidatus Acidoferrales bacterium]|nr:AI-2E family transporter [Candidatus Acidoferrales bacterium]
MRRDRAATSFFVLGSVVFAFVVADRLVAIAGAFSSLLLTVFLAWLLTFLVAPAVEAAQRRFAIGRGPAVGFVYLVVLAGVGALVAATALIGAGEVTDMVSRSDEITSRIHELLVGLQTGLGISQGTIDLGATFDQAQRAFFASVTSDLAGRVQAIGGAALAVGGSLFLIVILSLYAVLDFDGLLDGLHRIVPNRYAEELALVQESVGRAFGGFLRTQIVLVILQALLTVTVGVVFGLPYLYVATVGGALAMFVPFFGPPLALLPPILIAAVFRPDVALPVIVVLVVTQTVLVNVLQPRLMQRGAGIHPILVLVALLLGAQIAGLWGALFGIPIAAVASLLVRYAVNRRAVDEVEGIDLESVVEEMQAADPELPLYEAVAIAADRAEALTEDRAETPPATADRPDPPG